MPFFRIERCRRRLNQSQRGWNFVGMLLPGRIKGDGRLREQRLEKAGFRGGFYILKKQERVRIRDCLARRTMGSCQKSETDCLRGLDVRNGTRTKYRKQIANDRMERK